MFDPLQAGERAASVGPTRSAATGGGQGGKHGVELLGVRGGAVVPEDAPAGLRHQALNAGVQAEAAGRQARGGLSGRVCRPRRNEMMPGAGSPRALRARAFCIWPRKMEPCVCSNCQSTGKVWRVESLAGSPA